VIVFSLQIEAETSTLITHSNSQRHMMNTQACVVFLFGIIAFVHAAVFADATAERISVSGPLEIDLRLGTSTGFTPGVSWVSQLTPGTGGECECKYQGVLKLAFLPTARERAQIDLTFEKSEGWTFNLGDSQTNNGYSGDANTQANDAEVHSINNNLYFYGRDNPSGGSYGELHIEPNFVGVQPYTTLTLNAKDELLESDNGFHQYDLNSYKLFQLNSQPDSGGVNNDQYLGMNRVISPSRSRVGRGLCKVRVQFFPS
jgi:hypothetical protein